MSKTKFVLNVGKGNIEVTEEDWRVMTGNYLDTILDLTANALKSEVFTDEAVVELEKIFENYVMENGQYFNLDPENFFDRIELEIIGVLLAFAQLSFDSFAHSNYKNAEILTREARSLGEVEFLVNSDEEIVLRL